MPKSLGEVPLRPVSEKSVITNDLAQRNYPANLLNSLPDPTGSSTLTLIDELGNGGFHTKLYPPPTESNCTCGGPFLPLIFSDNRYA